MESIPEMEVLEIIRDDPPPAAESVKSHSSKASSHSSKKSSVSGRNRPNLEIRVPDWLITYHVT